MHDLYDHDRGPDPIAYPLPYSVYPGDPLCYYWDRAGFGLQNLESCLILSFGA